MLGNPSIFNIRTIGFNAAANNNNGWPAVGFNGRGFNVTLPTNGIGNVGPNNPLHSPPLASSPLLWHTDGSPV